MGCSSVPLAWLAKVPERILHVTPLRSLSLNALFPNPYDWFSHCNGKPALGYRKCLNLHPLATRFRRFLLEASLLGLLHRSLDELPRTVQWPQPGVLKPGGGGGDISSPIIWLYPPNILNGFTLERKFGEKRTLFLMKTFTFFFGLHLNLGRKSLGRN